jgi:hypothetical protein
MPRSAAQQSRRISRCTRRTDCRFDILSGVTTKLFNNQPNIFGRINRCSTAKASQGDDNNNDDDHEKNDFDDFVEVVYSETTVLTFSAFLRNYRAQKYY